MDPAIYAGWLVTHAEPRPQKMLDHPRRAVVTAPTYGGATVTLQVFAVARAPGRVCVEQDIPGRAPWNAWIPDRLVLPV